VHAEYVFNATIQVSSVVDCNRRYRSLKPESFPGNCINNAIKLGGIIRRS